MIWLLAADSARVIQVSTIQAFIGIGAVILAMGIAWGKLTSAVKNVENGVKELKTEVKKLSTSISTHSTEIVALKVHTKYGVSHSPIRPNEAGKKLLADSKFNEQYPKLQPKLFKMMDKLQLRTLYDYERAALEVLVKLKDDPLIDPLKEFAVNNPSIPLDDIFLVGSWILRDDYEKYRASQHPKT